MPPALSLDELLIANVMATLATITIANGYATNLAAVVEGRLSPLETHTFPYASVIPAEDSLERDMQIVRREMHLVLDVWIDAAPATAGATLRALMADVKQVMQVDTRRGGHAQVTLEGPAQYIYHPSTERLRGGEIAYAIAYRTAITNPRVAG